MTVLSFHGNLELRLELEVDNNPHYIKKSTPQMSAHYPNLNIPDRKNEKNFDMFLRFNKTFKSFWCVSRNYIKNCRLYHWLYNKYS